jgi:bacteriocin-like protein
MSDPKYPEGVTEVSDVELSEDELDQISGGVGKMTRRPYTETDSRGKQNGDLERNHGKIPALKGGTIDKFK